jgi:glycosyltransferase involved in cell wall biosynthesis
VKILIINNHIKSDLGGSELQCHILAKGLSCNGHEVVYLAPGNTLTEDFSDLNYRVVSSIDTGYELTKALLAIAPDVIYWRRDKKNIYQVAKAAKEANIPFVFAISHISNLTLGFGNPMKKVRDVLSSMYWFLRSFYELRAIQLATYITVLNPDLVSLVKRKHVQFVANSVPRDLVPFKWSNPYIAWIASIKPEKRPEEVLALAADVRVHGVDIIMVGEIQHNSYAEMMDSNNLPDNVHYLGKRSVEEVNGILQGSLFHIHTCLPEGFGNVFIQAWAFGRASVSLGYDPGGYLEKYQMGFNANNDRDLFKSMVVSMILNSVMRESYGRKAAEIANRYFTTERMVSEIEEVLSKSIVLLEVNSKL